MKDVLRLLSFGNRRWLCLFAVCLLGSLSELSAESRYALSIGVETYDPGVFSNLKFAEDDAERLAGVLDRYGYETITMTSAATSSRLKPTTGRHIREQIDAVCKRCSLGDTLVISLSGHGVQFVDDALLPSGVKETYFCPEDADVSDRETLVPISEILLLVESSAAKRKLLLIDACRNEVVSQVGQSKAAARKIEVGTVHETRRSVPGGMSVLFSCQSDEVSWESNDLGHSVFTYFVSQYLEKRAEPRYYDDEQVNLDGLVAYVRKKTNDYVFDSNLSNRGQYPVMRGSGANWSLGELKQSSWMRFRGPNGSGHGTGHPPIEWDDRKNVRWKVPLSNAPGESNGNSSPIVVGNRVFVTSATAFYEGDPDDKPLFYYLHCFDRMSGDELWTRRVSAVIENPSDERIVRKREDGSHPYSLAHSTPASDGNLVYAYFGLNGVLAFDLEGQLVWGSGGLADEFGYWGASSSPIAHDGYVYVAVTSNDEQSGLWCLTSSTGDRVWKNATEGAAANYSTPILSVGREFTNVVLKGKEIVGAFDAYTGQPKWSFPSNREYVGSVMSPSIHDSKIYGVGTAVFAIDAAGNASVVEPLEKRSTRYSGSTLVVGDYGIWITESIETIANLKTGEIARNRIPLGLEESRCHGLASPVAAGGRIYLNRGRGHAWVYEIRNGELVRIAENEFESTPNLSYSSPAICDGEIFIRTNDYLYCIAHD